MNPDELAATIIKEKKLMQRLHQKYSDHRVASAKFLEGLKDVALAVLSAWISSKIGFPIVLTSE